MKKIIATLVLLISVICGAMAQNDAVYVYRNDGKFDAFFKSEIDSMTYSHYDADSVYHNEWQAQIVYTPDSIYYIPLEAIDSISFTTPETKYSPDVVKLDKLMPYLRKTDGMVLTFDSSLPSHLKPRVGDVLLYEGYDNPMFEKGFAGRVSAIDNDEIACDSVSLSEVYEELICFGEYQAVEEPEPNSGVMRMRLVPKRVPGNVSSSIALKGSVGSLNSLYLSLDGALKFDLRIVSKITDVGSPYIDLSLTPSFSATLEGGIKGEFKNNLLEKKVKVFGLPIPDTPFYVYISSGPVIEPSLSASVTTSTGVNFGFKLGVRYENNNWHPYGYNVSKGFSAPDITGNIDGSVFMGIGTEVGVSSYGDIIKFYIEKKLGVELSANLSADLLNSDKYEELSKAKVDLDFVGGVSANALLKLTKWIQLKGRFDLFSTQIGINTWKLLPTFSVPEVSDKKPASAKVTVTPKEDLLAPVSIGIGLLDKDDNLTESTYLSPDYRLEKNSKEVDYSYEFCSLKSNETYVACPMVKWMGMDIKATPTQDFTLEEEKVSITTFKVTDSSYSKGAYFNDGLAYDYKFDAATTVEIASLEGVSDWGYVYKDPYGNVKRISLMGYGTSYTDTRYAYYRNEAKSTVCLYGYVKYEGDDEYYYGEPHDYPLEYAVHTCPDNNHPHAIDLGLPSGTKWCCMNVGASSPEQYGGYYAWGETSEKSVYDQVTYSYYNGQDTNGDGWIDKNFSVVNIGSDIAGTSYDVAHVRMGGSWRMPSFAQQQELMNNCTRTFTLQNGVYGILMTGNNGGRLFLPATGYRAWCDLKYAGSIGYYWSSSLDPLYDYHAYYDYFNSSNWHGYSSGDRNHGHSVRAVCP